MTYDFAVRRDRWSLQIGRFMIAFGTIEQITHEPFRGIPRDPIGLPAPQMVLGTRIDLQRAVLNGRQGKDRRGSPRS
jgi:hypothetical protein